MNNSTLLYCLVSSPQSKLQHKLKLSGCGIKGDDGAED